MKNKGYDVLLMDDVLTHDGTLTLVGGTIYAAFLFWRKKVLVNRLYGNILIAAGALAASDKVLLRS